MIKTRFKPLYPTWALRVKCQIGERTYRFLLIVGRPTTIDVVRESGDFKKVPVCSGLNFTHFCYLLLVALYSLQSMDFMINHVYPYWGLKDHLELTFIAQSSWGWQYTTCFISTNFFIRCTVFELKPSRIVAMWTPLFASRVSQGQSWRPACKEHDVWMWWSLAAISC